MTDDIVRAEGEIRIVDGFKCDTVEALEQLLRAVNILGDATYQSHGRDCALIDACETAEQIIMRMRKIAERRIL